MPAKLSSNKVIGTETARLDFVLLDIVSTEIYNAYHTYRCLFRFILLIKDLQSNTVSGTDEFTQEMSGSLMSKRLRMYKCERCNSQYMGLAMLRQHCKDVHGDQKYYKCHVCGKLFSHPSSRNIHLRLHSGEKPYKCTTCGKQFRVSSHLKDHVRVHTGVWNFFSSQDHAIDLAVFPKMMSLA